MAATAPEYKEMKNKERRSQLIRISIAVVLLVATVYYTIKDIDLVKLWNYIVNADYFWVILCIPVMILSHWVRAFRWRTMLEPIFEKANLWNLFSAVMAGYAVNNVLPRGGEFLRPYVFARRQKISFTSVFATIIVERFLDILILFLMLAVVWFTFREQIRMALPSIQAEKLLVPVLILMGVLILSFWPPLIKFILRYTVKPLSNKLYEKVSELFEKFAKGFSIIRTPSRYLRLTVESLLIWLLYTIPNLFVFYSFGFDGAPYNMGFDDAILLIVISGIAFTISPVPGALGVFHILIQNTLMNLYGVGKEEALAYATIVHGVGYLVQVVVGGAFLLRENIKRIPRKRDIEMENIKNDTSSS
jgi:glycosyltransferase 2 family protein